MAANAIIIPRNRSTNYDMSGTSTLPHSEPVCWMKLPDVVAGIPLSSNEQSPVARRYPISPSTSN